jgi:CheY-like chemotaxis protein
MAYLLLVDDDTAFRDALAQILTLRGYHVATAGDGLAALARLSQPEVPDLILLDLVMPRMDGTQFRSVQRQYTRWATIPVVVFADAHLLGLAPPLEVVAALPKDTPLRTLLDAIEQYRHHRERPLCP